MLAPLARRSGVPLVVPRTAAPRAGAALFGAVPPAAGRTDLDLRRTVRR